MRKAKSTAQLASLVLREEWQKKRPVTSAFHKWLHCAI